MAARKRDLGGQDAAGRSDIRGHQPVCLPHQQVAPQVRPRPRGAGLSYACAGWRAARRRRVRRGRPAPAWRPFGAATGRSEGVRGGVLFPVESPLGRERCGGARGQTGVLMRSAPRRAASPAPLLPRRYVPGGLAAQNTTATRALLQEKMARPQGAPFKWKVVIGHHTLQVRTRGPQPAGPGRRSRQAPASEPCSAWRLRPPGRGACCQIFKPRARAPAAAHAPLRTMAATASSRTRASGSHTPRCAAPAAIGAPRRPLLGGRRAGPPSRSPALGMGWARCDYRHVHSCSTLAVLYCF